MNSGHTRALLYAVLALAIGILAAMVLSVPIITAQIRNTQVDNTKRSETDSQTLTAVRETTRVIKDCTQPGGKCYRRGQRRTADVLASVQRIILLSAVCSVDLDPGQPVNARIQQITACVTTRLTATPRG